MLLWKGYVETIWEKWGAGEKRAADRPGLHGHSHWVRWGAILCGVLCRVRWGVSLDRLPEAVDLKRSRSIALVQSQHVLGETRHPVHRRMHALQLGLQLFEALRLQCADRQKRRLGRLREERGPSIQLHSILGIGRRRDLQLVQTVCLQSFVRALPRLPKATVLAQSPIRCLGAKRFGAARHTSEFVAWKKCDAADRLDAMLELGLLWPAAQRLFADGAHCGALLHRGTPLDALEGIRRRAVLQHLSVQRVGRRQEGTHARLRNRFPAACVRNQPRSMAKLVQLRRRRGRASPGSFRVWRRACCKASVANAAAGGWPFTLRASNATRIHRGETDARHRSRLIRAPNQYAVGGWRRRRLFRDRLVTDLEVLKPTHALEEDVLHDFLTPWGSAIAELIPGQLTCPALEDLGDGLVVERCEELAQVVVECLLLRGAVVIPLLDDERAGSACTGAPLSHGPHAWLLHRFRWVGGGGRTIVFGVVIFAPKPVLRLIPVCPEPCVFNPVLWMQGEVGGCALLPSLLRGGFGINVALPVLIPSSVTQRQKGQGSPA